MTEPSKEPEVLAPEEQEEEFSLMDRIDGLASFLADFAERDGEGSASPAIKVKIFGELVAWSKVRRILDPQGTEGNRLKEFSDELKSGQRGRNSGSPRLTAARKREPAASGAEIRKLIRSLPTAAHAGGNRGGQENPEREGVGDRGSDRGGGTNLPGDGQGNLDGPDHRG